MKNLLTETSRGLYTYDSLATGWVLTEFRYCEVGLGAYEYDAHIITLFLVSADSLLRTSEHFVRTCLIQRDIGLVLLIHVDAMGRSGEHVSPVFLVVVERCSCAGEPHGAVFLLLEEKNRRREKGLVDVFERGGFRSLGGRG